MLCRTYSHSNSSIPTVATGANYWCSVVHGGWLAGCPPVCWLLPVVFLYLRLRQLYEADFHKLGIYTRSGQVWATGSGFFLASGLKIAAVAALLSLWWSRAVRFACDALSYFFSSSAHGLLRARGTPSSFTTLLILIMREGRVRCARSF